ncbi:MAG: TonB-dependent receptor [Gemmatimonadetes bacterium]|nr:TonB-dependent receptor [Gemmatimonadota bacterium]
MPPWPGILALAALAVCGARPALAAQAGPDGSIAGVVLDAAGQTPLAGALVMIEAAGDATVLTRGGSGTLLARGFTTVTDAEGHYRFARLPPGRYRLRVRHLGHREAVLDIELSRAAPFEVSVGLVMNPIQLEPVSVHATTDPFGRTRSSLDDARFGRLDAEEFRRVRFLSGDVRVLTQADVTEAVTLGEGDLLRALQRLPGVSARDDYTAGLWTRGAPWGQTRAYYDGLPLFNPVHAVGLLSAVNTDVVGAATFHPGVRDASIGEGAAGVLDVSSRGAAGPGWRGLSELSVASARGTLEAGSSDGKRGVLVSVRRSYVDLATRLAQLTGGDSATYVPYAFLDLAARADLRFGERTSLEASGLWAEDDVRGTVRRLLRETRGRWGNRLGRVTLAHGMGGLRVRASAGLSRFEGALNPPRRATGRGFAEAALAGSDSVPKHDSTFNGLTVAIAGIEVTPVTGWAARSWAAGLQLVEYTQAFDGQYPRPYPVAVLPDKLVLDERLAVPVVWAERRWSLGSRAALQTGLRIEAPGGAQNVPSLAVAPRLSARYAVPGTRASLSVGAGRSWQYTQALAPAGPSVGPDLYVTDVWLLAGDTIPAVRADVATASGEIDLGVGWIAGATVYARHQTGVAVPDPTPGELTSGRPIFVPATNRAWGLELGLRRIVGRWTGSLSYTWSRSTLQAQSPGWGSPYPSPADRRHVLDGTVLYRASANWRVGAAMTAASGAPFSRFILGAAPCTPPSACPDTLVALQIESPNGVRTSPYASVDFLLDWEGTVGRATVGAFLQVRNLLNRSNAVTYGGSEEPCDAHAPPTRILVRSFTCDRFDRGVPLLPLAGVRIVF